jgi:hypothetical protein
VLPDDLISGRITAQTPEGVSVYPMKKLLSDCASSAFNKQVRVIPAMIGIKKII